MVNARYALAAAALAGCEPAAPDHLATERDSAGVTVIDHAGSPWAVEAPFRVVEPAVVDIGRADGPPEVQFDRIQGVVRLADGGLAVADGGTSEIRFYDAGGRFVEASGRVGSGPGEYRQIESLGLGPGDSLWVFDFGLRRFTVLDRRGDVVRTLQVGGDLSAVGAVGRLPDGSFVVRELWSAGARGETRGGLTREPAAVARLGPDGSVADTVGLFPGREVFLCTENGRIVMSAPPLARETRVALRGEEIVVGDQARFTVSSYTPAGTLTTSLRVPDVDLGVAPSDVDRYVEAQLAGLTDAEARMRRDHLLAMDVPPTKPAYGALEIDRTGRLWVAEYSGTRTPRRWVVFDRDGALVGAVTMPDRFVPADAGADWVAGVWRDDLEVERVRLYRLGPAGDSAAGAGRR